MKKKLAALRQARGKQIELMEANVACSGEQMTKAYNDAKAEVAQLDAQIKVIEELMAETGEADPTPAPTPAAPADATLAAERARVTALTAAHQHFVRMGGTAEALSLSQHITAGTSQEEFARLAFNALAARSASVPTNPHHAELTHDERDKARLAASQVIDHMLDRNAKVDPANEMRGMKLSRLAEELLARAGKRRLNPTQIVELSMHGTADFPLILADSARKQLLSRYQLATPSYKKWAKGTTTQDFKTMSRLRLGEAPAFLTVAEGSQITIGTMTESREQYALKTGGRGVAFTRQMFINDDIGAFLDILQALGDQAARWENGIVYAILTANAAMADTVALFHASHSNLGSGAIGNTALDAMFTAMGVQKGLDGSSILNLEPKYLVVPKAKASTAAQAMMASGENVKPTDRNLFAGRLEVVSDGVLDASSTTVWYGFADPSVAPTVEYAHLEGAEGPQIIREENSNAVLGIQFYSYLDFNAKAIDFRGGYKSTGV